MKKIILKIILSCFLLPAFACAKQLPVLNDISAASNIDFTHSFGDDSLSNIVESAGVGVVLFDYDNDGDLDIYFVNGAYIQEVNHPKGRKYKGKLQNRLFQNQGDNTFLDVTKQSGTGDTGYGMAAVSGDIDNDGDQDLYITNYGSNTLLVNNGDGTFVDITDKAGVGCKLWSLGATFLDFDKDGYLDLYVANYLDFDPDYRNFYPGDGFPGPLSYNGQPDILYRNLGNNSFEDVSKKAGITNSDGRGMGVASADIDGDGYLDIFVANDGMENYLYRNNGDSTFEDISLFSGTGFGQNGEATSAMSPEFGDFDLDGHIDILIPDMGYSSLFINDGKTFFTEISSLSGLASACGQYTSWSGNFFDFNGDTLLDIFISNGDSHFYEPEEDLLLLNKGKRKIVDVSTRIGKDFNQKKMGRGSAVGDIDNDGDLDIIITNLGDKPIIYRTDTPKNYNWLQIAIKGGAKSNRDGIGTRVKVTTGKTTQTRDVLSSSGYLSQSDRRLHFGLGNWKKVKQIEILWPGGKKTVHRNVKGNRLVTFTEPE